MPVPPVPTPRLTHPPQQCAVIKNPLTRDGNTTLSCSFKNIFSLSGQHYNHSLRKLKIELILDPSSKIVSYLKTETLGDSEPLWIMVKRSKIAFPPLFRSLSDLPTLLFSLLLYKVIVRTDVIMFVKCLEFPQRRLINSKYYCFFETLFLVFCKHC